MCKVLFVCFFLNFFKFFTDFVISALSSILIYNPRQKLVNVRQMQPGLQCFPETPGAILL